MDGYKAAVRNELYPAAGGMRMQSIHTLADRLCYLFGEPSVLSVFKKYAINGRRCFLYIIKLYIINV